MSPPPKSLKGYPAKTGVAHSSSFRAIPNETFNSSIFSDKCDLFHINRLIEVEVELIMQCTGTSNRTGCGGSAPSRARIAIEKSYNTLDTAHTKPPETVARHQRQISSLVQRPVQRIQYPTGEVAVRSELSGRVVCAAYRRQKVLLWLPMPVKWIGRLAQW